MQNTAQVETCSAQSVKSSDPRHNMSKVQGKCEIAEHICCKRGQKQSVGDVKNSDGMRDECIIVAPAKCQVIVALVSGSFCRL